MRVLLYLFFFSFFLHNIFLSFSFPPQYRVLYNTWKILNTNSFLGIWLYSANVNCPGNYFEVLSFTLSIDFPPECQLFPVNHILSGCQLLKKILEAAFDTTVTCKIPEARQDQALVPQTCSMEWQLCCLGHLLRTGEKKKKEKMYLKCCMSQGSKAVKYKQLKTAFCRTRNHCLKIRHMAVGRSHSWVLSCLQPQTGITCTSDGPRPFYA